MKVTASNPSECSEKRPSLIRLSRGLSVVRLGLARAVLHCQAETVSETTVFFRRNYFQGSMVRIL